MKETIKIYQSGEEYFNIKNAIFAIAVDVFTVNKKNVNMTETEAYMAFSHGETFVKNLLKDVINKVKRSPIMAAAAKEDGFDNTKAFANKINFRGFSADPFQDLENNALINDVIKMAWFYVFVPSQFTLKMNTLAKTDNVSTQKTKKHTSSSKKRDFGKSWDINDYIDDNDNEDDNYEDDEQEIIDKNNEDANHKFVVITIQKNYIKNGEGYWGEDDLEQLEKDNHRLCYIYDANEFNALYADSIPDHTPDWLYDILNKYENSVHNGYCNEDVESTFEISNEMFKSLIKDPRCSYYEDYEDAKDENADNNNHSFRILKYSKAQRKRNEETNPGMIYPDRELVYIFDASEQFLPDHTPDWLYDIMNSVDQYGWDEVMESIFDVSPEFLDKLSKHPQCVEYRECTDEEAGFDDINNDDYEEHWPPYDDKEKEFISTPGNWNLDWPLKHGGRKAPLGGGEHLEIISNEDGFYDFIFDNGTTKINKKAMEDIDKIDWSAENAGIEKVGTTSSGVDYVAGWVCQDYGLPILIFMYWDGKNIRAFIPFRGNPIDTITKSMINGDFDNDEYLKKNFGIIDDEWDDYDSLGYNFNICLEEFEARLTVIDENGNEITKPKLPKCKMESMNRVIELIYDHYGFTRMELYWEISLKQHYLTVRDIYYNPIIYIYKDTPNLIYVDNYLHTAPIDINKAGWEKKLISKLDAIIKREKQMDQELENNGFNDALRKAGLYDIFH